MADVAEISFDDKQWQELIKKVKSRWNDIQKRKEFGGIISASVYQDVIKHFEEEKGPDGKWDEWSDAYEAHLQRIGRAGNKKLQFSGKLRQSFTPTNWRGTQEGILFYNAAKTKGGFPYAKHHDTGASSSQGNPRSFMWLSNKAMSSIVSKVANWLAGDK